MTKHNLLFVIKRFFKAAKILSMHWFLPKFPQIDHGATDKADVSRHQLNKSPTSTAPLIVQPTNISFQMMKPMPSKKLPSFPMLEVIIIIIFIFSAFQKNQFIVEKSNRNWK